MRPYCAGGLECTLVRFETSSSVGGGGSCFVFSLGPNLHSWLCKVLCVVQLTSASKPCPDRLKAVSESTKIGQ
jgi:hypothetical protein